MGLLLGGFGVIWGFLRGLKLFFTILGRSVSNCFVFLSWIDRFIIISISPFISSITISGSVIILAWLSIVIPITTSAISIVVIGIPTIIIIAIFSRSIISCIAIICTRIIRGIVIL